MGAGEPLVSVLLISHDRPQLIGAAIASLVAQTLLDRDILVVDNRSPRSGEIAGIVAGFPGVRLVSAPTNLGFPGGINLGLRHARGRYVMITEDDIALPPDCLATLATHLDAHPATGVVTGRLVESTTGKIL